MNYTGKKLQKNFWFQFFIFALYGLKTSFWSITQTFVRMIQNSSIFLNSSRTLDRLLFESSVKAFQTSEQSVLEPNQCWTELNRKMHCWTHWTRADESGRQLNRNVVKLQHSRTTMKSPSMQTQSQLAGFLWLVPVRWEEES